MQFNDLTQNSDKSYPQPTNHFYLTQWLELQGVPKNLHADFFSWNLKNLPNFWELKDMVKAVDRLILAIENNEKIGIYGDYDVDGTTSCALFYRFFQKLNYPVTLYQPSRFIEGYGVHKSSLEQASIDGIKVLVTVDCGTSSIEAADVSLELGIDLIITDHHKDAAEHMPKSFALINPNRRDENPSTLQGLAGVGVAFAVCVCLRESLIKKGFSVSSLYDLLPYVAIGTISDLAPLNSTNLILCRHGMKSLLTSADLGLKKFLENKELSASFLDSDLISFLIGPMINSKGRIDHPDMALKLLTTNEPIRAEHYHQKLMDSNAERKKIQNTVFEEAKKIAQKELEQNPSLSAMVLYQPHWHEGVIGIVAAKLVEEFNLPTLVFTNTDQKDYIKASARTAKNLDLFQCLKSQEQFFKKFGGHKAAAGLTLEFSVFQTFKNSFLNYMSNNTVEVEKSAPLLLPIDFSEIDGSLLQTIYSLAPFGQNNPMPKWLISGAKISKFDILKQLHVKWSIESFNTSTAYFDKKINGITFNFFNRNTTKTLDLLKSCKTPITLEAWIKVNIYRGKSFLQLHVDKIHHEILDDNQAH